MAPPVEGCNFGVRAEPRRSLKVTAVGRLLQAGLLLGLALPLSASPANQQLDSVFKVEVRPLLETYCSRCHGPELRTAGIAFSDFTDHASVIRARSVWVRALRVLRENEMPPVDPQPTVQERQLLVDWIDSAVNRLDWSEFRHPGSETIARLNRDEYNNTIRDLTGLDLRPAGAFPVDGQGESGFRNDRDGLFVAPLLVGKYLDAADRVVNALVETREPVDSLAVRLEIEDFLRTETNHEFTEYGLDFRNYQQTVYRYVTFPRFGRYRFRVRAWGESPIEGEAPGVTLRVASRIVGQSHVTADVEAPRVYEFEADIPRGSHRVSLHWFKSKTAETSDRNRRLAAEGKRRAEAAKAAGEKLPPRGPVLLSLDWVEIKEDLRPGQDGSLVWIAEPGGGTSGREAARRVLANFAERAFRGPVRRSEARRLTGLYDQAARRGEPFEQAVAMGLKAILVSPRFLYRAERAGGSGGGERLNDHELASRLSYFLWMSMPDDSLMRLAGKGALGNPAELRRQAARMLADPRAGAFTSTFIGQWLGFAELGGAIKPDDVAFPEFTPALGKAMLEEATRFFDRIVREDRSLLELLDSDYTFLNEELARHYGIKGVVGREFRPVQLVDERRGGVLGMGAVLTATSLPVRTSPVVRGKWVLETMLGEELPPPPPDAGELPEPGESSKGMTLREMLEMHRDEERCAACPDRIDPMGFGLENFDAIGRWRDTDNGQPVDATGTLPSGQRFEGPVELKEILLGRREEFARMVTSQMLKFALGRDLEYYDEPTVREISRELVENDCRPSVLVARIVDSYPFRFRQPDSGGDGGGE